MQTTLDCLVCFMRQALAAARLSSDDEALQRRVVEEAGRLLARVDFARTPPENAVPLYRMIAELTGRPDPFAALKRQSNDFALGLRDQIRRRIEAAEDPLLAAVRFAICANIIDYAAQHEFDAARTMAGCQEQGFVYEEYALFSKAVQGEEARRPQVLYLADNCGEIVFDGLLIRELQRRGCRVTLAVRGGAIINDATPADAAYCGLTDICPVIDNGTDCPGTPLADCSPEFLEQFRAADCIISKGMGNYETLSDVRAPIFFLFTVKCGPVAGHVRQDKGLPPELVQGRGEMVLIRQVPGARCQVTGTRCQVPGVR